MRELGSLVQKGNKMVEVVMASAVSSGKPEFFYTSKVGEYSCLVHGKYFYACVGEFPSQVDISGVKELSSLSCLRFVLDSKNWDILPSRLSDIKFPEDSSGNMICDTEDGTGQYNSLLFRDLSSLFKDDSKVFQCIYDCSSDDLGASFIGIASEDNSRIGILLNCGKCIPKNKELALDVRNKVEEDLYKALSLKCESIKDKMKQVNIHVYVYVHGKRRSVRVRLSKMLALPVSDLVTWSIKKHSFYYDGISDNNRRFDYDMSIYGAESLMNFSTGEGFSGYEDFAKRMYFPLDACTDSFYDIDLEDTESYSDTLIKISEDILNAISEFTSFMDDCFRELVNQVNYDQDLKDTYGGIINISRSRYLGINRNDFEKFCENKDVWFPKEQDTVSYKSTHKLNKTFLDF